MRQDEFRELLSGFHYTERQVEDCFSGVSLLEEHLRTSEPGGSIDAMSAGDVPAFSARLIGQGLNDRTRLVGVYHYAGMIRNYDLQVGVLELLDGYEILGNLYQRIGERLGKETQEAVFDGVSLPVLGTTPLAWTQAHAIVFPRLQALADAATVRGILQSGLRNLPDGQYALFKERFEQLGDIDAFLEDRGKRHLERLETHRDQGTPYFNQFIDGRVLDFVRATPEIGRGVRQGNAIIEVKIPHQAIEYLAADRLVDKQYHVCHCPLVKESIRLDDLTVPAAFCDFCPSFNAKPWEVAFGCKLEYEVLESALRGGIWCKFAIHLPPRSIA